jgi:hypothetical protein
VFQCLLAVASQLDQQLLLGHLGHQVRRPDRRERGHGQDQGERLRVSVTPKE